MVIVPGRYKGISKSFDGDDRGCRVRSRSMVRNIINKYRFGEERGSVCTHVRIVMALARIFALVINTNPTNDDRNYRDGDSDY